MLQFLFFSWLPDSFLIWLVNTIIFVGVVAIGVGFFVKMIPLVNRYKLFFQIGGIIFLLFGTYFKGSLSNEFVWRERVRELEAKVKVAEEKAIEANNKIETKVITKIVEIKERTNQNANAISKYVTDTCQLSNVAVVLHDSASQNELPPSTIGSITGTSKVKIPELLTTVTENYGTCNETREKLKAWQEWYKTQKEIFESAK